MSKAAPHRELRFDSFEDVLAEAERLRRNGYQSQGNWDLAQVCNHLRDWVLYPMEGFPPAPGAMRVAAFMLRRTFGPGVLRKMLATGVMPKGMASLPISVHQPGGDETEAIQSLRDAYAKFDASDADPIPSPVFGPMTHEEAKRVQLIHAAHHLGYLADE